MYHNPLTRDPLFILNERLSHSHKDHIPATDTSQAPRTFWKIDGFRKALLSIRDRLIRELVFDHDPDPNEIFEIKG